MYLATSFARIIAVIVLVTLLNGPLRAALVIDTADGNGADTHLLNDTQDAGTGPDVVRGSADFMKSRYLVNARVRIPYIRFDLSSQGGGDRTGATLSLQLTFNNGNRVRAINVYGLTDNAVDDMWAENSTSYSNAPGFIYTDPDPVTAGNQPSNDFTIDGTKLTLLGTITTLGGVGVMTSTTAALNLDAFLASDTNNLVTLALVRVDSDSNVDFNFATKENTTAGVLFPTLTLPNAVAVPEASAVGFGLLLVATIFGSNWFGRLKPSDQVDQSIAENV